MSASPEELRQVADLLDTGDVFDIAAGAIADLRPQDRDAGECIAAVIAALRAAADAAN